MRHESTACPVLYWNKRTRGDSLYAAARKEIHKITGQMPNTIDKEPDFADFFAANPGATLFYPVYAGATGWWGGLLGTNPKTGPHISDKIIISAECQLMVIKDSPSLVNNPQVLMVAEIHPTSAFFKTMNSQIATSLDMLATDAGTILGLFRGRNEKKFSKVVETTGNSYLGCLGYY